METHVGERLVLGDKAFSHNTVHVPEGWALVFRFFIKILINIDVHVEIWNDEIWHSDTRA